jgi:hypothetical protein
MFGVIMIECYCVNGEWIEYDVVKEDNVQVIKTFGDSYRLGFEPIPLIRGHIKESEYYINKDAIIVRLNGYTMSTYNKNGTEFFKASSKSYPISVARLMAETFLKKPEEGYWVVTHLDGNRLNNRLDNLAYMTRKEFNLKMGINGGGSKCAMAVLTQEQVDTIRADFAKGVKQTELAKRYKTSSSNISNICRGKVWKDSYVKPEVLPKRNIVGRAKVDKELIKLVCKLLKEGNTGRSVAEKLGIHPVTVSKIKNKHYKKVLARSVKEEAYNLSDKVPTRLACDVGIDEVREIRQRYPKTSKKALCKYYNITSSLLNLLVTTYCWDDDNDADIRYTDPDGLVNQYLLKTHGSNWEIDGNGRLVKQEDSDSEDEFTAEDALELLYGENWLEEVAGVHGEVNDTI